MKDEYPSRWEREPEEAVARERQPVHERLAETEKLARTLAARVSELEAQVEKLASIMGRELGL
jgi:hypothetical protein